MLCDSFMPSKETAPLLTAGAAGVVMQKLEHNDVAYSYPLPASVLDVENGRNLYLYLSSPGYVLYYVSQIYQYIYQKKEEEDNQLNNNQAN